MLTKTNQYLNTVTTTAITLETVTKDYYEMKQFTNMELNKCLRIDDYKE